LFDNRGNGGDHRAAVRLGVRWPKHDLFPMVPIMSRAAPGIGFVLTMSTTDHHPFHVARLYNALDPVTVGRIAWNAATSAYKNEAANHGYKAMVEHDLRYERAQEHLKVVTGLWDTVEPDAIVMDRERGYFVDPETVHLLNHKGRFYDVRGPLPVLPSPQGRPPIIQVGQSGPGMELAATYADMQFVWRRTVPSMKEHRAKLDALLAAQGCKPRDVGMLWLMRIQAAESASKALAMERRFLDSLPPDAGLMLLSTTYGLDFSIFDGRNILLGAESAMATRGRLGKTERALVEAALAKVGANFDPEDKTSSLSVARLRLAQIARALVRPGEIMMLDEPTAVLSEPDAEHLMERIQQFRSEGNAVLYVTHRLTEVMRLADRITILRDGRSVGVFRRGEITRDDIVRLMAKDVAANGAPSVPRLAAAASTRVGEPLTIRDLSSGRRFSQVSVSAAPGRIVGIAGVQSSGHGHFLRAVAASTPSKRARSCSARIV
jgi:alkanesulfonate monooxygenase SsuD/methylene tetrahydromethanopterin reductase-like flavin-dependent oxidoreductase (luciferase family)